VLPVLGLLLAVPLPHVLVHRPRVLRLQDLRVLRVVVRLQQALRALRLRLERVLLQRVLLQLARVLLPLLLRELPLQLVQLQVLQAILLLLQAILQLMLPATIADLDDLLSPLQSQVLLHQDQHAELLQELPRIQERVGHLQALDHVKGLDVRIHVAHVLDHHQTLVHMKQDHHQTLVHVAHVLDGRQT
jgi:hypothetical protein